MEKEILPSGEELVNGVFSSVSFRGGKILSFLYKRCDTDSIYVHSQESGNCSFSIYGHNIEKILSERCCAVSFKNGNSLFHVVLPFLDTEGKERIASFENENFIISTAMSKLLEFGVKFESLENCEEFAEFVFFVPFSFLYSCLKICSESLGVFLWHEEKISIVKSEKNFLVELRYKKTGGFHSEILPVCARFAYLFDKKTNTNDRKIPNFTANLPIKYLTFTYK